MTGGAARVGTPFTPILRRLVERVPGALGAIFADWEGEPVDTYAPGGTPEALLYVAAHYGVILNQVQSVLHLTHFGEAEELVFQHQRLELVVRAVDRSYFVILATEAGAHLATSLRETLAAAGALRAEMD
jgi:predicted regulator of Ras-like GTPase activity (Roadblock/LC7/MglB family)